MINATSRLIEETKTAMHCKVFSHRGLGDSFNELIDRVLSHSEKNENISFEYTTEGHDDLLKIMEPRPIGPRIEIVDSSEDPLARLSKKITDSYWDTRYLLSLKSNDTCVHHLCNGCRAEQMQPLASTHHLPRDLFRISTDGISPDLITNDIQSLSARSFPAVVSPSPNGSNRKKERSRRPSQSHPQAFRVYQADHWDNQYKAMKKYREANGDCFVPQDYPENPSLSMWIKRQRYQYKLKQNGEHSTLTQERQSQLDDIGFIWHSHNGKWEDRYTKLLKYRKEYGHTNLPSRFHDKQLAIWLKSQRRMYKSYIQGKSSSMTAERIAKLEEIGFDWTPRLGRKRKMEK